MISFPQHIMWPCFRALLPFPSPSPFSLLPKECLKEFRRHLSDAVDFDILQCDLENSLCSWAVETALTFDCFVNSEFVVVLGPPYFLQKLRVCLQEVSCCLFLFHFFLMSGRIMLSMSYSWESSRLTVKNWFPFVQVIEDFMSLDFVCMFKKHKLMLQSSCLWYNNCSLASCASIYVASGLKGRQPSQVFFITDS